MLSNSLGLGGFFTSKKMQSFGPDDRKTTFLIALQRLNKKQVLERKI